MSDFACNFARSRGSRPWARLLLYPRGMSTKKDADKGKGQKDKERPAGVPRDEHALAGAAVVSGAVTGAAVGAIGGPLGAVVGGAIGTAVGAVAGAAMEREMHRHDAHEKELDDEIGITDGSLGVPAEMKKPSREVIDEAEREEEAHQEELDRKSKHF